MAKRRAGWESAVWAALGLALLLPKLLWQLVRRVYLDVTGGAVVRPAPAPARITQAAMAAWSNMSDGFGEVVPLERDLVILYRSRNGAITEREIRAKSARPWSRDAVGVWAWCHLRRGPRTFLSTGIEEMVDAESGEVIGDPHRWLLAVVNKGAVRMGGTAAMPDPVAEQRAADEARRREQIAARDAAKIVAEAERAERAAVTAWKGQARQGVLALVYLAKSDGRMDEGDRAVIGRFIKGVEARDGRDFGWADITARLKSTTCDQAQFLEVLKSLRAAPVPLRDDIKRAAVELAGRNATDAGVQRAAGWIKTLLA